MSANGTPPPPSPKSVSVPERGNTVTHGFAETSVARSAEMASAAVAAQATAAVQARYVVAMKQPRDLMIVRAKLLKDCSRPAFADAAIYHKPVGKGIEGPSIRLAEAAARAMTNIYSSVTAIYDDPKQRIIRVTATDLESNITFDKDVTVPKTMERSKLKKGQEPIRARFNSNGDPVYLVAAETDDDILNTENALASKALRVCLLRLIPGDVLDEAMTEAYATLNREIKDDPDKALKSMCDQFELQLGIGAAQLADYLGHPVAQTTAQEIALMRKLFAALKDGETNWTEVMENRTGTAPMQKIDSPAGKPSLTDVAAASKAKRESAPTPKPEDTISRSAGAKAEKKISVKLADGSTVDPTDEDAAARAATAPTQLEIERNGPPPVDPMDPPDWMKD